MIYQLKNPNNAFPHNGWPFKDPRTGFTCNGWEGTPAMHAVKIIAHRRANPHVYPREEGQWFDQKSVEQEVYAQKAKVAPHLFKGFPDNAPVKNVVKVKMTALAPTTTCPCGSKDFEPIYCKTCAGHRVTGYKCKSCGKELRR